MSPNLKGCQASSQKKHYAYKYVHMYYIIFNLTVTALAFPVLIRFVNSDSCDLDFMRAQSLTT